MKQHKQLVRSFSFPLVMAVAAGMAVSAFPSDSAAVIVTINVTGTIGDVTGSYAPDLVTGQAVTATFVYDTDEAEAFAFQDTPSVNPGHEFTSFYEFMSPPYGGTVNVPAGTFVSSVGGLVVNNDMTIEAADVNGYLAAGTYDWIEVLGSSATDGPTGNPADGEEWTLALFGDTSWITDGSLVPDDLPGTFTPVMLGIEVDEFENEIGFAWVDVTSVMVSSVPEPSRLTLLALGAMTLIFRRRR